MTNEDLFCDMPMIRIGRDANPGVGRPSKAGVTAIRETRTKTDRTIARRTHTSRSTSRPIERNDNKRSARRVLAYASSGPKCKSDVTPKRHPLTTAARKFVDAPSTVPNAKYPTAGIVNDAALNSPLDSQRNFRKRAVRVSGGSSTV